MKLEIKDYIINKVFKVQERKKRDYDRVADVYSSCYRCDKNSVKNKEKDKEK